MPSQGVYAHDCLRLRKLCLNNNLVYVRWKNNYCCYTGFPLSLNISSVNASLYFSNSLANSVMSLLLSCCCSEDHFLKARFAATTASLRSFSLASGTSHSSLPVLGSIPRYVVSPTRFSLLITYLLFSHSSNQR